MTCCIPLSCRASDTRIASFPDVCGVLAPSSPKPPGLSWAALNLVTNHPSPALRRLNRKRARDRFADASRPRGLLVAFEGPDGSGKTTQRKLFKTWLMSE